jgi:soluble lytic murein transglycosylase
LSAAAVLAAGAPLVQAQNRGDDTLLEMQQAFRKGDRKKLEQLLPAARGHALEPWAAYWELKARLERSQRRKKCRLSCSAMPALPGRPPAQRLAAAAGPAARLGQFAEQHPHYRMSDDREVRCYALLIDQIKGTAPASAADEVRSNWYAQRDADDGCTHAAGELYSYKKLSALDIWRKARLAPRPTACVVRGCGGDRRARGAAQLKEVLDAPSQVPVGAQPRQAAGCARSWCCWR